MTPDAIPTFAVSGGDVSGKSSLLLRLAEHYGTRIFIVREAATLLYSSPWNPLPDPGSSVQCKRDWLQRFQLLVAGVQIGHECAAQHDAATHGAALIVCDRGLFDHYAFLDDDLWPHFESSLGLTPASLAPRYNAVLYLESLVLADPDLWQKIRLENNAHRRDRSEHELSTLERRLRGAWERYRAAGGNLHVIEGKRPEETHFEVAKQICDALIG